MHSPFVALAAPALLAALALLVIGVAWSRRHWIPPRPPAADTEAGAAAHRRLGLALVVLTVAGALGSLSPSGLTALVFVGLAALAWTFTGAGLPARPPPAVERPMKTTRLRSVALWALGLLGVWSLWIAADPSVMRRGTMAARGAAITTVAPSSLHLAWDSPSAALRVHNRGVNPRPLREVRVSGEDWRAFVPLVDGPALVTPGAMTTVRLRGAPDQFLVHAGAGGATAGYRHYRDGAASLSFRLGAELIEIPVTFHGNRPSPPWRTSVATALLLVLASLALARPPLDGGPVADRDRALGPRPLLALSAACVLGSLATVPLTPAWCASWPVVPALAAGPSTCIEGAGALRIGVWPWPVPVLLPWVLCAWSMALSALTSSAGIRGALHRTRAAAIILVGLWISHLSRVPALADGWLLPCSAAALLLAGAGALWRVGTTAYLTRLQRLATLVLLTNELVHYAPRSWWVRLPHLLPGPSHLLLATIAMHVAFWILLDGSLSIFAKRLGFLIGIVPRSRT